jgi:hypothetical protein
VSWINWEKLKSPRDTTIPFTVIQDQIGTAPLIHDTLVEFGKITKEMRVTNLDGINNVTVQIHSPSGRTIIVPPNSALTIPEWTSFVSVTPDAITGNALLELDLCESKYAYQ